jgi:hypothetical protein
MRAADIANALGAHQIGNGWRAACPVHGGDSGSSFSISESSDGQALVHCFAGCPQDAVIEALRARGLWGEAPHGRGGQRAPARRIDRVGMQRELEHELLVLAQVVGAAVAAHDLRDPHQRAGWTAPAERRASDQPMEREELAVARIQVLLDALYPGLRHGCER